MGELHSVLTGLRAFRRVFHRGRGLPSLSSLWVGPPELHCDDWGFGLALCNFHPRLDNMTTCRADVVTYERTIAQVQLTCWKFQNQRFPQTWTAADAEQVAGRPVQSRVPRGCGDCLTILLDAKRPAVQERANHTRAYALGSVVPLDVPPGLREAYEALMDPLAELNRVRKGRVLFGPIDVLKEAGRTDLLLNVARGPRPMSRIHAVRALRRLGHPAVGDSSPLVRALKQSPVVMEYCSGCLCHPVKGAELLK